VQRHGNERRAPEYQIDADGKAECPCGPPGRPGLVIGGGIVPQSDLSLRRRSDATITHALGVCDPIRLEAFARCARMAQPRRFRCGADHQHDGSVHIFPAWVWIVVAVGSAMSLAIRSDWQAYREEHQHPRHDMRLETLVKRIVGSDDLRGSNNPDKAGKALNDIRERALQGESAVWGRRDALTTNLELYPLAPIPADYWDEFAINFLRFTVAPAGESMRIRGTPQREMIANTVTTTLHPVARADAIYSDLWFCAYQVDKIWPEPKRPFRWQLPIRRAVISSPPK
jgi:hypothetical protein